MKTVGIIGGIAPESTVEYYRRIIALVQRFSLSSQWTLVIITDEIESFFLLVTDHSSLSF
jgi:aspartate/glutamate racemase